MRWNDEITLLSAPRKYQDSEGAWHEGPATERTVMCNARNVSLYVLSTVSYHDRTVDTGFRPEAQVEVRSVDYEGETQALYRVTGASEAKEYIITSVTGGGETCILTLGRRVGND